MPFLIIFLVIILFIAFKSIKVVKQSEVYIIERLGKFHKIADAGLTIIIPFVDHVRSVVSLKEQTMDIPPQGVITEDNVTIILDSPFRQKNYNVRISSKPYTAMCVDVFNKDELTVTKYINDEGLNGKYYLFIKINGKIYDTDMYIYY